MRNPLIAAAAVLALGALALPAVAAKAKPKKVWTDENLGDVTGTISVVGSAQPRTTATS